MPLGKNFIDSKRGVVPGQKKYGVFGPTSLQISAKSKTKKGPIRYRMGPCMKKTYFTLVSVAVSFFLDGFAGLASAAGTTVASIVLAFSFLSLSTGAASTG